MMQNKEFYERLQNFLVDNMKAFIHSSTDVGELNQLMIEINERKKQCEVDIPEFMKKETKDAK